MPAGDEFRLISHRTRFQVSVYFQLASFMQGEQDNIFVEFVAHNARVEIANITVSDGQNPLQVVSQTGTLIALGKDPMWFFITTTADSVQTTAMLVVLPFLSM